MGFCLRRKTDEDEEEDEHERMSKLFTVCWMKQIKCRLLSSFLSSLLTITTVGERESFLRIDGFLFIASIANPKKTITFVEKNNLVEKSTIRIFRPDIFFCGGLLWRYFYSRNSEVTSEPIING